MTAEREARVQATLAEIDYIKKLNYAKVAEKHKIHYTTLSRCYQKKTRDLDTFRLESKQLLSNTKEEVLINYLNQLADYGLFATSRIVINIIEERLGR
jgi:hypothetical protein